jgi:hypothetical protein
MECSVIKDGKRVVLTIDGKTVTPVAYMTYNPRKENFTRFSDIGVNLFSFGVYLGDQGINSESGIKPFRSGFYKGYNEYDFTEVDKDLEMITSHNKGAYIIPRVYLDCPQWWEKENKSELSLDAKGRPMRQSYASDKWREDALSAIYALIDHISSSQWDENVIGYQVAAGLTEEWQYHHTYPYQYLDYSNCNLKNFREWLRNKYESISDLNREWNTVYKDYENIVFPNPFERSHALNGALRDPKKERHVIDFYTYHSHIMADTILFFCEKIKKHTNYERLTGAFYGYILEIMSNDYGHCGIHEVLKSEYIDFLASPNSYMDARSPGIDWPYMSVVDSAKLHGKLWFIESDTRTSLTRPLKESMPHAAPDNSRYSFEGVWKGPGKNLSLSLMLKGFGRVLTGGIGTWWFDMWGGWFNDPDYLGLIEKTTKILEEHIKKDVRAKAEIAVFVDPECFHYFSTNHYILHELVYSQRKSLGQMGVPYHIYLTEDLELESFDIEAYNLYIFLNNVYMKDSLKECIDRKIKRNGRTLLWIYLQDMFTQSASITGFNIKYAKDSLPIQAVYKSEVFPSLAVVCPEFSVADLANARVLATQKDTNIPVCTVKCFDDYNSIYCTVPNMPVSLLRDIANMSRVHIYCHTNDVVYADEEYIIIHASYSGEKRIYLPVKAIVYDGLTDNKLYGPCTYFDFPMEQYDTKIFRIIDCEV